jgi:hypothetical protein
VAKNDKNTGHGGEPLLMSVLAAAYIWQLHGLLLGVLGFVFMQFLLPIPFALYFWKRLAKSANDPQFDLEKFSKDQRKLRWVTWVIIMVIIALTGARIV